ncbi:MAG TPA: ABC transporter substrate-binding protein, partial [Burkholderiaceae bacterium]|nr:ABC transporter substrate-binding protein [Burkholderiaceae bacterium]
MATIPAMASEEAPDALIERLSNEVLETIRKDPQLRAGDTARINALIDEKVLPYVDFEKMTRLAVGRGWRQASEAQRTQLVEGFRTLLIRTYSGALSEVKDQKIEMLPLRMNPGDP